MQRKPTRLPCHQTGAEIIEFVVTLPVILLVFVLFVELGVGFINQATITNASRAGAREAIRGGTNLDAESAAQRAMSSLIYWKAPTSEPAVVVQRVGSAPGDEVRVTVSYDYDFVFLPRFASTAAGLKLTARTVMKNLTE